MPEPALLPSAAQEARVETSFPGSLERERWLVAWELRPENPAIVHDARIHLRTPGGAAELLGAWTPGQPPVAYPSGTARPLAPGQAISLAIHYARGFQHRGKEMRDQSELHLWFSGEPPAGRVRSFAVGEAPLELPGPARILGLTPLAVPGQAEGRRSLAAILPGGARKVLLAGRGFQADWPLAFHPAAPLDLPRGARLQSGGEPGETWIEASFTP
jgi:hypothetical protein